MSILDFISNLNKKNFRFIAKIINGLNEKFMYIAYTIHMVQNMLKIGCVKDTEKLQRITNLRIINYL